MDFKETLAAWGLAEYHEVLKDSGITEVEILEELINTPNEFSTLIPILGVRLKFQKHVKNLIKVVPVDNRVVIVDNRVANVKKEIIQQLNIHEDSESGGVDDDDGITDGAPPVKKPKLGEIADFDLRKVLLNHPLGEVILIIYKYEQELNSRTQSYLCDIIDTYFVKIKVKLENDDHDYLAHKIIEIFPNECKETYYVPPTSKKQSRNNVCEMSKGKLVDKYRKLVDKCTYVRNALNLQLVHNEPVCSNALVTTSKENESAVLSRAWLQDNRDSSEEVLHHWNESYYLRVIDFESNENKNYTHIFNDWPILKESCGHELIEIDFLKKYNNTLEGIICGLENCLPKLLSLYKKKLNQENNITLKIIECEDISQDNLHYAQLQIISSVLPPKSCKIHIKDSTTTVSKGKSLKLHARQNKTKFRLLSNTGLDDVIEFRKVIGKSKDRKIKNFKKMSEVLSVKINGTLYKKDNILYVKNDKNNDPVFGKIKAILKNPLKQIFFVYTKFLTLGFNNHIKSYEIVQPLGASSEKIYEVNIKKFIRPIIVHKTATGSLVVCRRDLE